MEVQYNSDMFATVEQIIIIDIPNKFSIVIFQIIIPGKGSLQKYLAKQVSCLQKFSTLLVCAKCLPTAEEGALFHAQSVPSCACFTAVMSKEKDFFPPYIVGFACMEVYYICSFVCIMLLLVFMFLASSKPMP